MNAKRWIHLLTPSLTDATIDNDQLVLSSVVSMFSASCAASIVAAIFYHLGVISSLSFLIETLGHIFIPGSQLKDLAHGHLGSYGGVVVAYVTTFIVTWILNLKLPGITMQNLPTVIFSINLVNAVLAWTLFFPWIRLG